MLRFRNFLLLNRKLFPYSFLPLVLTSADTKRKNKKEANMKEGREGERKNIVDGHMITRNNI